GNQHPNVGPRLREARRTRLQTRPQTERCRDGNGMSASASPLSLSVRATNIPYSSTVASASSRPRLRAIETIVIQDPRHGRALMLRDTQGVTSSHAVLPMELAPVVGRFNGANTCEDIARLASKDLGERVPVDVVVRIATELEDALFLDGTPYRC